MTNLLPEWRYIELNARIRKRAKHRPRRERLAVRTALERLHIRYREAVPIWNPLHRGVHNDLDGGVQWLDFVIFMPHKRIGVLLFGHRVGGGPKEYERRYLETKEAFLQERNIPRLTLGRISTSQEYEILIYRFCRKESGKESHAG